MNETKCKITATYDAVAQVLMIKGEDGSGKGYGGELASKKLMEIAQDDNVEVIMVDEPTAYRSKLIRTLHMELNRRAVDQVLYRAVLADMGVEHCTELSDEELEDLIEGIRRIQTPEDVRAERSGILLLLSKLGITGSAQEGWGMVNDYLRQPRIAGKTLYEMSYHELKECRKRLRAVYYKTNKEI